MSELSESKGLALNCNKSKVMILGGTCNYAWKVQEQKTETAPGVRPHSIFGDTKPRSIGSFGFGRFFKQGRPSVCG